MKKFFITLLITFTMTTFAQETLGLAERRALKEYQDTKFPEIKKGIETAAGYAVPMDIKWEQIAKVGNADVYKEDIYWNTTIFEPLRRSLETISSDKMGKEALKSKLKKVIVIHNEKTAPSANFPNGLKFEAGVLTINWTPYSNVDETFVVERTKALKDLIESKL